MPAVHNREPAILSTVVNDINLDMLQKKLDVSRKIWRTAYLAKDFATIETVLSADFRFINGKENSNKTAWHSRLKDLWQTPEWQEKPLLPERVRYHFFTPTECIVTLYFKNETRVSVMQELWMIINGTWQFNALSMVNR